MNHRKVIDVALSSSRYWGGDLDSPDARGLWSGWTPASWFAAPNEGLDGRSAVDVIDLDLAAVIRAARALGGAGEASPMNIGPTREVAVCV